jgi:uncharacterized protein (TIGR02270 family)
MEKKQTDIERIAITGIGLVTSLGCSAPSSLAAIRGGIANFVEHETVLVNEDEYGTVLSGARIARLPEHVVSRCMSGVDRAVALLAPAIRECVSGIPNGMLEDARWRLDCRIEPAGDNFSACLKAELHDLTFRLPRVTAPDAKALGRCLFFENIIQAIADLRKGTCHFALVGCVDSLCDDATLERLVEVDLLKSGTNPEGIIAGEAAGVLLLEMESHARSRHAAIHAYISSWGRGIEPNPWTGTSPSAAKGLTCAFREAFEQLAGKGAEIDLVIADLNGERARAHEWGFTEGRIIPVDDKTRELLHPADCAGDCGSAMGTLLVATAADIMNGTSSPSNAALSTSDDCGARRVLCLEKGDDRVRHAVIRCEQEKRLPVLPAVIEQHRDEASFLWLLRNRLTIAPHCGVHGLARHDERIEAHLDGLRLAGDAGWALCGESLRHGNAGDYFAAALLAFTSGNEDRITGLLEKGGTVPDLSKGIISALGWLPLCRAEAYITNLIADQSPDLCRIGIAACAIHGFDPGTCLRDAIQNENHALKARGLKAAGELGRIDLLPALVENLSHDDEACRFFAAWGAALLGEKKALPVLQSIAASPSRYQEEAVKAAFRMMAGLDALTWHAELASNPHNSRPAVIGAGTAGDSALVHWLIEQMQTPELARVAAESFSLITGADISAEGLEGENQDDSGNWPSDDPDDCFVGMDPDENLPWPDPVLVGAWWRQRADQFSSGERYFLGKTISAGHLRQALRSGSQRRRAHAAMELALLNPGQPLFNTRAPGFKQILALRG